MSFQYPGLHKLHVVPPVPYDPGPQSTHDPLKRYSPEEQAEQVAEPSDDVCPSGQSKQKDTSSAPKRLLYVPEVQFLQSAKPNLVSTQIKKYYLPNMSLYVPFGHGSHEVALLSGAYIPFGHCAHSE